MILSYITFLPIDVPHAVANDIGFANSPIPVRLNVIELDVVAILPNVSNDFNIVVNVLHVYISFWICYYYLWSMLSFL